MGGQAPTRRTYFLSNACQTCKQLDPAYACEICQMVYYCSEKDRRTNWPEHSHLCRAIYKLCKARGVSLLYAAAVGSTPDAFRALRHTTAMECASLLGRPLQPWELEILYWPKVCGICFKQGSGLRHCEGCAFVYACSNEHVNKSHGLWCSTMKLYHEIMRRCVAEDDTLFPKIQISSPLSSMEDLLNYSAESRTPIKDALASELLTYPLTVYRALATLPPTECVTVHVVGAELQAEVLPWSKWEHYLLHLLPGCQEINLIFIGPDLQPVDKSVAKDNMNICTKCRDAGKTLQYKLVCQTLYHDYVGQPNATKPNLITALNAGLYRTIGWGDIDSWTPTLKLLFEAGGAHVPVLVTEYTLCEIQKDLERVQKRFPNVKVINGPEKNPFSSFKPNLNIISDEEVPVIFKNYFSAVLSK